MNGYIPPKQRARMAVSNPNILLNPSYQSYVNTHNMSENTIPHVFYNKTAPLHRSSRFEYYDSIVTNSRLHPVDVKTHNKVYDPYAYTPAVSTILRSIEKKANAISNSDKLLPVFK